MTDVKFEQAESACQRDFDEYKKSNKDCHGFDYGNAWRAGRTWTLESDVVRGMAEEIKRLETALEDIRGGFGGLSAEDYEQEVRVFAGDALDAGGDGLNDSLAAYERAVKEVGDGGM